MCLGSTFKYTRQKVLKQMALGKHKAMESNDLNILFDRASIKPQTVTLKIQ